MKADRSGTLTEQKMYRMGYRMFKEWTATLPQCRTCARSEKVWNDDKKNLHCMAGGFATPPGAVCDEYKKRKGQK